MKREREREIARERKMERKRKYREKDGVINSKREKDGERIRKINTD